MPDPCKPLCLFVRSMERETNDGAPQITMDADKTIIWPRKARPSYPAPAKTRRQTPVVGARPASPRRQVRGFTLWASIGLVAIVGLSLGGVLGHALSSERRQRASVGNGADGPAIEVAGAPAPRDSGASPASLIEQAPSPQATTGPTSTPTVRTRPLTAYQAPLRPTSTRLPAWMAQPTSTPIREEPVSETDVHLEFQGQAQERSLQL